MSEAAAAHEASARLQTILKAVVVGAKTQDPGAERLYQVPTRGRFCKGGATQGACYLVPLPR